VVCDILCTRVTADKDSVVLKSASVRTWFTDLIFVENLDTPRAVLGVRCDLLRARVTAEKDSVVLKSECVRILITDLTFIENRETPGIRSSV